MSRAIVRLGNLCSGHGFYPPRANNQGSPNTFIKGFAIHRETDSWLQHCKTVVPFDCHVSIMGTCTPGFLINGLAVAKVGDPVVCGSFCAEGETSFQGI
jgi:uncharacterized Zn-binding protein involved in type VI secretion